MAADYQAIVVGAGPGGLAAMAALLDAGVRGLLWVDRDFGGGRLNRLYREISSNTKVGIYLDALRRSSTCSRIVDPAPRPNAVTRLEELDPDETCELALAGNMVMMLQAGILGMSGVESVRGEVKRAELKDSTWTVTLPSRRLTTPRLLLCTGSHPIIADIHKPYNPRLTPLDLDACMVRSLLAAHFPADRRSVVGVIGNSHSGVLACRNLYELAESGERDVRIINFQRSPVRFAEYREDGIVYDNTGIKGATAEWARATMQPHQAEVGANLDSDPILRQVDLTAVAPYRQYLPQCTHLVYAIGYEPSPLPDLYLDSQRINIDMVTSGFSAEGQSVPGLYGCGIAYPELVADPEGHVEAAVGIAKFFKFTERVKDQWAKDPDRAA